MLSQVHSQPLRIDRTVAPTKILEFRPGVSILPDSGA
jgi:hypothetical protein